MLKEELTEKWRSEMQDEKKRVIKVGKECLVELKMN